MPEIAREKTTRVEPNHPQMEEEKLLEIVDLLRSAYARKENVVATETTDGEKTLTEKFKTLIESNIPGTELRKEISEKIEIWKRVEDAGALTSEEIDQQIKEFIDGKAKLYIDSSEHIQMYNRKYVEDSLGDRATKIFENETVKVEDLRRILHVSLDLNGLKTLNEAGEQSHNTGNQALKMFSKILKDGETTLWLREQGIEVIPAHQSGDEFMMLICSDKDLGLLVDEIKQRYSDEIKSTEAADLLSFEAAKKYFTELKIYDSFLKYLIKKSGVDIGNLDYADLNQKMSEMEASLKEKFKYKLGSSIGIATLGDGLSRIAPDSIKDKDYKEIIRSVIGQTIGSSDERATENKKKSRAELAINDPFLALIYNRSVMADDSAEKGGLILENVQLETEREELAVENERLMRLTEGQDKATKEMWDKMAQLEKTLAAEKEKSNKLQKELVPQEIKAL
ncbi:MAG: hypothetical protein HY225_03095 [Candidatus Vogelbacteria bacterium]|nr:hypothetical protein [Candidatus Vogelbacteria bacterium]